MNRFIYPILKSTLCILAIGVLFVSCQEDEFSKTNLLSYKGKYPDESSANLHLSFSDSGRLNFQINTPLLNKYNGEESYMDCPEGIEIISYDFMGKPEAILKADYAISNDRDGCMEARNHVIITNLAKGDTITTEKIVWDKRNRKIYSDVPVRQTRADGTVYLGTGFDADEKFTKYTVRNPRGEIIANDL